MMVTPNSFHLQLVSHTNLFAFDYLLQFLARNGLVLKQSLLDPLQLSTMSLQQIPDPLCTLLD